MGWATDIDFKMDKGGNRRQHATKQSVSGSSLGEISPDTSGVVMQHQKTV